MAKNGYFWRIFGKFPISGISGFRAPEGFQTVSGTGTGPRREGLM